MKNIVVKTSMGYLLRSKAAVTCLVFVALMIPLGLMILWAGRGTTDEFLKNLYYVGAALPFAGALVAVLSFVLLVFRRRKKVLEVGDSVKIAHSGVDLPLEDLAAIQLWSQPQRVAGRSGVFMAFLPKHVDERLNPSSIKQGAARPLGMYIVEMPQGATPPSFEVADLVQSRFPQVEVSKLGRV